MRMVKAVILGQLALLLMTSVAPLCANAAQRMASFPPDRRDAIAVRCDRLADSPYDPQRAGAGVPIDRINVTEALPACQRAAAQQPERPRYRYLYGRVLDAAKRYDEAIQQYAAADRAGHPLASASLGSLYATGQGVMRDLARAATFYRRAGDAGFADAYANLGMLYIADNPPNYAQAFSEFDHASRVGSALALAYLGELYTNGLGVAKNQARAIALFQQAADRGEPEGMLDLGLSYYAGAGVQRDPATAFRWLSRAAAFGLAQAQDVVGYMYENGESVRQSDEQAIAWYRKSAAQSDTFAMTHLAQLLNDAGNSAEAMTWYRRAAVLGDPVGMTELADMLSDAGNGAEAVDWYMKAAAKGFADAEMRLAYDYSSGKDTLPQDYAQAAYWYGKAVDHGDAFAMVRLGELYERGQGVAQNIDTARQLYTRAAGDPQTAGTQARYNLAHLNEPPVPNDNTPAPAESIPPQDAAASQRNDIPKPPHRPLPTQPSARSSDGDVAAAIVLGAILIGGAWLLSGSSGSTSTEAADPYASPQVNTLGGTGIFGQPCIPGEWGCVPYDMQVH
jgi:TPR repeat protein